MGCGLGNFFLHDKERVWKQVLCFFLGGGGDWEEGVIHQEAFLGWNLQGNIGGSVAGAPEFATWKVRLAEQVRDQTDKVIINIWSETELLELLLALGMLVQILMF